MTKKIILIIIQITALFSISCGNNKNTITFVTYSGTGEEYMLYSNSITKAYKEESPEVNLKLEVIPSTEYDKIMQIRANSKKLPDLFVTRVINIRNYAEYLEPLDNLEASKNNSYAKDYAVNGSIYGIPMRAFHEYVYYNKKIFEELKLNIPKTWNEYLDIIKKIKDNGKYIPLALGGKDSWVTYPFVEFMPYLVKNGDNVYSKMGDMNNPFSKESPVRNAYEKVRQMLSLKPSGDDPFGYGFTQASDMLYGGQAAMLAAGQWYFYEVKKNMADEELDNIGAFYLPVRDTEIEPFRYLVSAEVFIGINKESPMKEEAKKFIDWFFGSDYYKDFVKNEDVIPTIVINEYEGSPIFRDAFNYIDNPEAVLQISGNEQYEKIKNYVQFDVKNIGQELLGNKTLDDICNEWNTKWEEGRKYLNIY